jgi:tetratricopeptide (TPR) repeat protein
MQCGQTSIILKRFGEGDRYLSLATTFNQQYGIVWGQRTLFQLSSRGDVRKAEELLSEARAIPDIVDDFGWIDYAGFRVLTIRRDFREALRRLDSQKRDAVNAQFFFLPVELARAELYSYAQEPEAAKTWFEAARVRLTNLISRFPQESRYRSALGIAYAGLDLKTEARRETQAGVDLMPAAKDAWRAAWRVEDLARALVMIGDQDAAIAQLDALLALNNLSVFDFSATMLRIDPRWDSLRRNPKFQALLRKYGSS